MNHRNNARVWYITIVRDDGVLDWSTIYTRDEMAELLQDLDMKGYFIEKWSFSCVYTSDYLLRVEVSIRSGNFHIHNIPEMMEKILGNEEGN